MQIRKMKRYKKEKSKLSIKYIICARVNTWWKIYLMTNTISECRGGIGIMYFVIVFC